MALAANIGSSEMTGSLADTVPPDSEFMAKGGCRSIYGRYACTLPNHPSYIPHIAGTGHKVVAIWTDAGSGQ